MLLLENRYSKFDWNFLKRKQRQQVSLIRTSVLSLIFLIASLFASPTFSQSALEDCGITSEEQAAIMQAIDQMPITAPGTPMQSSPYDIPLHVYIFRSDEGDSPHPAGFDVGAVQAGVEIANNTFPDEMNFYICEIDIIENTTLHNTSGFRNLDAFYNYQHNGVFLTDDNAINVYYSSEGRGYGRPQGVFVSGSQMETSLLAHELGHAFGLLHTFQGTNCLEVGNIDYPTFLPDGTCNLSSYCSNTDCFDQQPYCEWNGDLICDTNVDPGPDYCTSRNEGEPCIVNIEGTDYVYYPDYYNIMSYYRLEKRTRFSDDQKAKMLQVLLDRYSYLIDTNTPNDCDVIADVDYLRSNTGNISYFKRDQLSENISLNPMEDIEVEQKRLDSGAFGNRTTDELGDYEISSVASPYIDDQNIQLTVNPVTTEAANGLSTFDIILLQKHIIGNLTIDDPYALIAGDVNNTGTITTLDIILIRRLILGVDQNFAAVPSWRFLPKYALDTGFDFEADFNTNPFTAEWDIGNGIKKKYLASNNEDSYLDPVQLNLLDNAIVDENAWSFIGIKSGDVNFTASWELDGFTEPSSDNDIYKSNLQPLAQNEEIILKFQLIGDQAVPNPKPKVWGYQFEVQFNAQKLELLDVAPVIDGVHPVEEEAYCLDPQNCTVRTLWYTNGNDAWEIPGMFQSQDLFAIKLRTKTGMSYGELGNYVQLNTSNYKNQFIDEDLNFLDVNLDYSMVDPVKFKLQNVYPNPVQTNVNFDFVIEQGDSPITITITDGSGQQVTTTRYYSYFGPTTIGMNVGNLSNGLLSTSIKIGNAQPFTKLLTKVN